MIYEIINPSDTVTIEADDVDVARAACLAIGGGKYGLEDEQGDQAMPVMLFGGYEDWCAESGFDFGAVVKAKRGDVIACLRSAICCGIRERSAVLAAMSPPLAKVPEGLV